MHVRDCFGFAWVQNHAIAAIIQQVSLTWVEGTGDVMGMPNEKWCALPIGNGTTSGSSWAVNSWARRRTSLRLLLVASSNPSHDLRASSVASPPT